MKKQFSIAILTIFMYHAVMAQNKLWEINLKETLYEVGWIEQTNDGVIIASGAKGLMGLNHQTGETIWHNTELKGIDKSTFLNIDGLPLFYVEYSPLAGKTRGVIINSSNGTIVYDTKDDDYRIKNFTLFADKGFILFELLKDKEINLMSFSLKTWSKNWITAIGEPKGLLQSLTNSSFIKHGPFFNQNGNITLGLKAEIYTLDTNTGKIIWQHETKKKIKALVYSEINNSLYLGIKKSKVLTVLDPLSGKDITPGKLKLRGTLIDVRPDNNNNLILVETEGFNIIDPSTNEFKWKKSFKINFLDEVIPHEKGFIAIGKSMKDGSIALVDANGKKIWVSSVKGYSYYVTPTTKGVLYVSSERSNILDYEKGKDVWKRDVKFRAIPAVTYDEEEDKVILFENKKAYKFDLATGNIELFGEDINLENVTKKTPLEAEYIKGEGYLLNTDQHISMLSSDGKLKYTNYFRPPSTINGLLDLAEKGLYVAGVDIDIQGAMNNINTLTALSNGVYKRSEDQTDATSTTSMVAGMYIGNDPNNMATVFEITQTRFYNSKENKTHKFIVAKVKEGDSNKHYIYMINKITGNIDKQIKLLDKTPNYLIDEIDNIVFINEKNHLISSHKF